MFHNLAIVVKCEGLYSRCFLIPCLCNMYSGHRIGTAEVESALVSHPQCAEAAVVGVEHEVFSHFNSIKDVCVFESLI